MTVRESQKEDIGAIAEIEKRCFSDAWSIETFESVLQYTWQHGFVAEDAGQVCGYAILGVVFEDAELLNIAVDIPYRGQKIGRALLTTLLDCAKGLGANRCLLEVRVSNQTAIALYERFGFTQIGVRARYYGDGEDALIMQTIL